MKAFASHALSAIGAGSAENRGVIVVASANLLQQMSGLGIKSR
jgi:hypothetical protein